MASIAFLTRENWKVLFGVGVESPCGRQDRRDCGLWRLRPRPDLAGKCAATKDVDAVMHHEPVWLRQAAEALAQEKRLALTTASKRRDMGCEMGTIDAMTLPRPTSLHDVATRALGGEAFDPLLCEILYSPTADRGRHGVRCRARSGAD